MRLALGADRRDIALMVPAIAAKLIPIGSATGLRPSDPVTFVAVAALLAVTGLAAAWGPARRAASVVPMTSLKHE